MTRYDPFAYGEVRLDPNKQQEDGGPPPDAEDLLFAEGESTKQAPPADSSWAMMNDEDVDDLLPGAQPTAQETAEFGAEILGEGAPGGSDADYAAQSTSDLMAEGPPAGTMDHLVEDVVDDIYGDQMAADPMAGDAMAAEPMTEAPMAEAPMAEAPMAEAPMQAAPAPAAPMQDAPPSMPPTEVGTSDPSTPRGKRREVRRRPIARNPAAEQPAAEAAQPKHKRKSAAPGKRGRSALAALMPLLLCAGGGTAASWFWVMQANPVMAGIIGAATLVGALFSWLFLRG